MTATVAAAACILVVDDLVFIADWTQGFAVPDIAGVFINAASIVAAFVLPAALLASDPKYRVRVAWLTIAIAPEFIFSWLGFQVSTVWFYPLGLWLFVGPALLTYAVLSRRIVDLGFVLNRAAVYSVVSLVLLGCFILTEWALAGALSDANRTTNVAAAAAIAIALGLSMRFVHTRVDKIVDRIFFAIYHGRGTPKGARDCNARGEHERDIRCVTPR